MSMGILRRLLWWVPTPFPPDPEDKEMDRIQKSYKDPPEDVWLGFSDRMYNHDGGEMGPPKLTEGQMENHRMRRRNG